MTTDIVVIGAGGFGREVLDVLEAWNHAHHEDKFTIRGVVDDAPSQINVDRLTARGYRHLGPISTLGTMTPPPAVVVAIGNPDIKSKVAATCADMGLHFPSFIHPSVVLGTRFSYGDGVVLCAGTVLSTNITLGDQVHVGAGAIIGHDSVIADYSSVNPGAVVSGEVVIGERTLVGAGSVILQGITIGSSVTVGAAACVTKEVLPGEVVVGIPARAIAPANEKDIV